MAAVSGPARHSRVSMSVSMSLMQGGTQSAPQGAILAAAAPYYQTPAIPTDVQPDRPIGYGAFGVVWASSLLLIETAVMALRDSIFVEIGIRMRHPKYKLELVTTSGVRHVGKS
ncbi:Nemo isoform E [Danaus plexippus plexippus]|uniref:Nemo isoform E n=1 Tax=Danaus plexippus plexippus TaxID=278856 RepID=A0A212F0R5_DANPL|nr:Nemo isoform E [Danaus plexippus plexippus]